MMATRAVTLPTSSPPTPRPRPRPRMSKARQVVDDADVSRLKWTIRQISIFWDQHQQRQLPSSPTGPNVASAPVAHPASGKRCPTLSRSAFWGWCDETGIGWQQQQQQQQGQRTACSPISTQAFWYNYQGHLERAWQAEVMNRDSGPAGAFNEERNRKRRRRRAETRTGAVLVPQLKENLLFELEQEDSDSLAESKSRWLRTWLSTLPRSPETTVWPSVSVSVFELDGSSSPAPPASASTACVSPEIEIAASSWTGGARLAPLLPTCPRTWLPQLVPLDPASERHHSICPSSDREEDVYSLSSLSTITIKERIDDDPGVSPDVDAPRRRKTHLTTKDMLRIAAAAYGHREPPGPQHGSGSGSALALALWARREPQVYLDAATHDRLLRRLGDRTSRADLAPIAVVVAPPPPPPSVCSCSTEPDDGNTAQAEAQSGRVDGAVPKIVIRPLSVRNDRWQTLWRGMFVRMPRRSSPFASSSSSSSPGDVAVSAAQAKEDEEEEEEVLIGTRAAAPIAVDDEGGGDDDDDHVQVGLGLELALQNAWRVGKSLIPRRSTRLRLRLT